MDILLHLTQIMNLIEKKKYNKPEVNKTELDTSVNLVLMSPN